MSSIKVKFRPSSIEGKEGTVYYQVIHNRTVRQINTDYHIFKYEWNEEDCTVCNGEKHPFLKKHGPLAENGQAGNPEYIIPEDERRQHLQRIREKIDWEKKLLKAVIQQLEKTKADFSTEDVVSLFRSDLNGLTLFSFMRQIIRHLTEIGRQRTTETYTAALRSFMKFRNGKDILLEDLESETMQSYEAYLTRNGITRNTVSFYMRILRAVYNRAVEKELTVQKNPFRHVYTGIDKTVKRAIPLSAIRKIKSLDLSGKPHLRYARDMFLFSFYTRGMSFIDMAFLQKSDLQNGTLSYRRHKTGQKLYIKWEKCMQEIAETYRTGDDNPYLLDIIRQPSDNQRSQYRNRQVNVNHNLKEIARKAGISTSLTMYCARHSWASIARSKHIPISVISEGMGHDSEMTTMIYLASLDNSVVDKANANILSELMK